MNIKTAKLCNIGGRQKNDDTVEILADGGAVRAYVGDGLGSYAGGKQASETAGQALLSWPGSMLADDDLIGAARQANQAVYALQESTRGNMKTTIVFLNIENDCARWMHVGDSRLYYFQNGKLVTQTTDHSVSQMAVMMGEITTHEIRFHEDRNRVLRSLGGENAKPELSALLDVSSGKHTFLLCTDGFWEYVYENEMEQTLSQAKNPQDWLNRMEKILKSRVKGNNDNYTAAAVWADSGVAGAVPFAGREAPAAYAAQEAPRKKGKGMGLLLGLGVCIAAAAAAGFLFLRPKNPEVEPVNEVAQTSTSTMETQMPTEQAVPETTATNPAPVETQSEKQDQEKEAKTPGTGEDNKTDPTSADDGGAETETTGEAADEGGAETTGEAVAEGGSEGEFGSEGQIVSE